MTILGEIKRRKVFQVAVVYAVVAWLLVQIVATVEAPLSLPEWFDTAIIVLLAVGFPIAVILSWAFDITPDGIRATTDDERAEAVAPRSGQHLNYALQILVLCAVTFLILDQYMLGPRGQVSTNSMPSVAGDLAHGIRRFELNVGETQRIGDTGLDLHPAISRDGRNIVFAAQTGGRSQLYQRPVDSFEAVPIEGTEGAAHPTFSPDGESVAFFTIAIDNAFKRISLRSGAVETLTDALYPNGVSWGEDGTLLIGTGDNAGGRSILSIAAADGAPQDVLLADDEQGYVHPHILPGEEAFLVSIRPGRRGIGEAREGYIAAYSYQTQEHKRLIDRGFKPRFVPTPTGHIVFARDGDLWAVPFDPELLEVTGEEQRVLEGVQQDGAFGAAAYDFSASANGTLVYMPGEDTSTFGDSRMLVWVDLDGNEQALDFEPGGYLYPRLSPDGRRLAVTVYSGVSGDVYVLDLDSSTSVRLTSNGGERQIWSPNGEQIAYRVPGDQGGIFLRPSDGGAAVRLTDGLFHQPFSFSANGTELIYGAFSNQQWDLYVVSLDTGNSRPLIDAPYSEFSGLLSPDGEHLLYVSQEFGPQEIFVRTYPDGDRVIPISEGGAAEAVWGSGDGEIYFRTGADSMWRASIETAPTFRILDREQLFPGESYFLENNNRPTFDFSHDRQQFLMMRSVDAQSSFASRESSLAVIENWFTDLERLAPRAR